MNKVITVKGWHEDELLRDFRLIDKNCKSVTGGVRVTFPDKFIEIGPLVDLHSTEAKRSLNDLVDLNSRLLQDLKEDRSVQDALDRFYCWDRLTSDAPNKNDIIDTLLNSAKNLECQKLTYIKISDTEHDHLNRFPRLLYFIGREIQDLPKEKNRTDIIIESFEKIKQEQKGEYLLSSVLDFLNYAHLYFFESFFQFGFQENNMVSVAYFLHNTPVMPSANERVLIPYNLPSGKSFLTKNFAEDVVGILNLTAQEQYDFMHICVEVINNWLAYLYNFHNFKNDKNELDIKKVLMAQVVFKQIIEGIKTNKFTDDVFSKVGNSFRLLDQLSNMLYGIADTRISKDERKKEDKIFQSFFIENDWILANIKALSEQDKLLSKILDFIETIVLPSIKKSGNGEEFKSFRHSYTHGPFSIKNKKGEIDKFDTIFERSDNVSSYIFLLPQILLLAIGANPEKYIQELRKAL
jgi:hypothetical protein